jgi:hypothetical protein
MKTLMLVALFTISITTPAQAGELGETYLASLEARETILDSMVSATAMLDIDGLLFASQRERMRHQHWIARIQDMVEITRQQVAAFHAQQSLYNAVCFEFAWRRLRLCWLESLTVCADLMSYEIARMNEADSRERRLALREFTAGNRELSRAFREQSSQVQRAIVDVDNRYGAVCMQYLLCASQELDRIGWNP